MSISSVGKNVTARFGKGQVNYLSKASSAGPNMKMKNRASELMNEGLHEQARRKLSTSMPPSTAGYMGGRSTTIRMNGSGYDNPAIQLSKYKPSSIVSAQLGTTKRSMRTLDRSNDVRGYADRIPQSHRKVRR